MKKPDNKKKSPKKQRIPSVAKLAAEWERKAREKKAQLTTQLSEEILPPLKAMGVATVQIEYSGYWGTRAINYVEYFDARNQAVDVHATWPACGPMIENVVHEYLPAGFEIHDGGQGDVYIDVEKKTLKIDHEENYIETDCHEEEHAL